MKHEEKIDVYDFGLILLEIIVGKPPKSKKEVDVLKDQVMLARITYYVFCIQVEECCKNILFDNSVYDGYNELADHISSILCSCKPPLELMKYLEGAWLIQQLKMHA